MKLREFDRGKIAPLLGVALVLLLAGWIISMVVNFTAAPQMPQRSMTGPPQQTLREVKEPVPAEVALASIPKFVDGTAVFIPPAPPTASDRTPGPKPKTVRDPSNPVAAQVALASISGSSPPLPQVVTASKTSTAALRPLDPPAAAEVPMGWIHRQRFVMCMVQDKQGNLWLGTEDECVWRRSTGPDGKAHWTNFTSKDGLGDDSVYAIACDHEGRIWTGHLRTGVSVYNGKTWQNYEVVGGISRPDSLSGPLGERIFAIKVCPTDGDVWISSSRGLARYSDKHDTWSYITRADGLPSDQVQAMDFDKDGNIYCGTQCDGIAMADAADGYKKWRQVTGPDEMPTTPTGEGLPTNLMNDVLVASDGTVYAATTTGLAWSKDRGKSWRYVRGQDYADKVRGLYKGPPNGWVETRGALLIEDNVMRIWEDDNQRVWAVYGHNYPDVVDVGGSAASPAPFNSRSSIKGIIPARGFQSFASTCVYSGTQPFIGSQAAPGKLPSSARPLSMADVHALLKAQELRTRTNEVAEYVGADWVTRGNWIGSYGQSLAVCAAMSAPFDHVWGDRAALIYYRPRIGEHHVLNDSVRYFVQSMETSDPRSLQNKLNGGRRHASWDDHGEAYPLAFQGPALYLDLKLPRGRWRVSMYFVNTNDLGPESLRDYIVSVKDPASTDQDFTAKPLLARCRVQDFWGGVYETFVLEGARGYTIKVDDNWSVNAICSGIFIDNPNALPLRPPRKSYYAYRNNAGSVEMVDPARLNITALEKPYQQWLSVSEDIRRLNEKDRLLGAAWYTRLCASAPLGITPALSNNPKTPEETKFQILLREKASEFYGDIHATSRRDAMKSEALRLVPRAPGH